MAGIYIHIPFCRQACHYCDFHFSTNLGAKEEMIGAIMTELKNRREYISEDIATIYFGGGTPSLLSSSQLDQLLDTIIENFNVDQNAEVTLEANPEDLSGSYLQAIRSIGINRLSIGIQTFDDERLKWMNRIHDSQQAKIAYEHARIAGFENISLDLIYALPDHGEIKWEEDLATAIELSPEHLSLYGLTIEPQTVFGKWELEHKVIQVPENDAARQYLLAIEYLQGHGYLQYEVSNFGKKDFYSRHNTAYWHGENYLGIGPGAHSFNGSSRQFNIRNNAKYLKAIRENATYFESENLSTVQRMNEQILTQLRTANGLNLQALEKQSGIRLDQSHAEFIQKMELEDMIVLDGHFLRLKPHGFLVADEIALRMFFSE